jgi:spore maturation protein B
MNAETFKTIIETISLFTIPVIFLGIISMGMVKNVKVYEKFVEGGKEGFDVFLRILPYLVAIFVAIGMFRVSGALDFISEWLKPLTSLIGMPEEVVPVALMKPLSGSGTLGLATEVIQAGPNSFTARVASTIYGSADTTFYIIAVYFGSVNIRKIRHAMLVGLIADLAGILGAVWVCQLVFGK